MRGSKREVGGSGPPPPPPRKTFLDPGMRTLTISDYYASFYVSLIVKISPDLPPILPSLDPHINIYLLPSYDIVYELCRIADWELPLFDQMCCFN